MGANKDNHQPVNKNKTEFVIYYSSAQVPKIKIIYQGQPIKQQKTFKYLGFYLDSKLSFRSMLDSQFVKLRKSHAILKYIHRAFPTFFKLKMMFFQTYTWPHLYTLATIFFILSKSNQNKINSFYRRCLRLIFCTYRVSTNNLHNDLKLPTLIEKYKKCLQKRLKNIQLFEHDLVNDVLVHKNITNLVYQHYVVKPHIIGLPIGSPNNRIASFTYNSNTTYFDKLCNFVSLD